MPHLTATTARDAKPADKRYWLWSKEQKGFGLSVQPTGSKSYYYVPRIDGKPVFGHIAAFEAISFVEALNIAREMAADAVRASRVAGAEYSPKKIVRAKLPADLVASITLQDVWAFYWNSHLSKLSSGKNTKVEVERHAAELLQRDLTKIDREDVQLMLNAIEVESVARRVGQALRAACNRADDYKKASGWPPGLANPCAKVKLPKPRQKVRAMSKADYHAFGMACLADEDQDAATFLLAIAECASRVTEVRTARVFEWDARAGKLRLSADRMKADEPGVMSFGPIVAARITALVKGKKGHEPIWPGEDTEGFRDFRKPLARVLKAACIPHKSWHDFRRTITAILSDGNFQTPHIEQHINHTLPQLQRSYWFLHHDHEKRTAMAEFAEKALLGATRRRR